MLKYFELLLELLETDIEIDKKKYLEIANYMIKNKNINVFSYNRHYFIFENFYNLINWKIKLEDFFVTWDITSKKKLWNKKNSFDFIQDKEYEKIKEKTCIILDKISIDILKPNIKNKNIKLFCI